MLAADYNWQSLSAEEQFKAARHASKIRSGSLLKKHKDLIMVGAGYRKRGGQLLQKKEICITFLVRKKRKMVDPSATLPSYIDTYITQKGKRRLVRIPTDVSESTRRRLENGTPEEYFIGKKGTRKVNGSACCILKDAMTETHYVLSCAHVFCLMRLNNYQPIQGASASTYNGLTNQESSIGPVTQNGPIFLTSPFNSLDAAIARIDQIDNLSHLRQLIATNPSSLAGDQFPDANQLYVSGAWGRVAVEMTDAFEMQYFEISRHYRIRLRLAYGYKCSISSESAGGLRPGFSGSALIDETGKIWGMHFYGDWDYGGSQKRGYAIPIHQIINFFNSGGSKQLVLA